MQITKKTGTQNTTYSPGRKIQYIVEHYTTSVHSRRGSALNSADWFGNPAAGASADYIVDDELVVQYNPDPKNRYCWAVGGAKYGNRGGRLYGTAKNANCISIEIASTNSTGKVTNANDKYWSFTDAVLNNAVELTKYLMKEYGIDADHVIRHYDVNGKPCPGIIGWNADTGDESKWQAFKKRITGSAAKPQEGISGLQAKTLQGLSESAVVGRIGSLFTADEKKSGILACVSMAQFILESGYGQTDLAQNANNCFGMKTMLSGNTWAGSTWDGKSVYTKKTQEQKPDGTPYYITADFRKYPCIEDSVADHSAYLLGAENGTRKRYEGLKGCTDYRKAVQIIKDGGYATDVSYVEKICNIIKKWNLTQYNAVAGGILPQTKEPWYRVRTSWADTKSQLGAFHDLEKAKKCADENPGCRVFDENGKCIYEGKMGTAVPFTVRVDTADLNIRTGPGTGYARTQYIQRGVYTIVEVQHGEGSDAGWGRLKSGAGWISLNYVAKA